MLVLRSPPFPHVPQGVASISQLRADRVTAPIGGKDRLNLVLDRLRRNKIGGSFWAPPCEAVEVRDVWLRWPAQGKLAQLAEAVARIGVERVLVSVRPGPTARSLNRWLDSKDVRRTDGERDPWSILSQAAAVEAAGDDEAAFLALVAGLPVSCSSDGPIAGWGLTQDADHIPRKGSASLLDLADRVLNGLATYRNPFSNAACTVEDAIDLLSLWRGQIEANRPIAAGCGIAFWKRDELAQMAWSGSQSPRLARGWRPQLAIAARRGGAVMVWPSRAPADIEARGQAVGVAVRWVEDGFIRSVGLGSDCKPPLSVVIDASGLHYDPSRPSDLEQLIEAGGQAPELLARAEALTERICTQGVGKYEIGHSPLVLPTDGRRRVLVVGQVEDDLSVRRAGAGVAGNLDLLRRARAREPDAMILYRPHPDVEAGHRRGRVADVDVLTHADLIVRKAAMATLLDQVDSVHVLSSLAGFEALLRGRQVIVHGQPFYAGWGLTVDLAPPAARRRRRVRLAELVAAALIQYPRYLDPVTRLPCPPEVLIDRLACSASWTRTSRTTRFRRLQSRLTSLSAPAA
ncbi:MAG: capsular polysaccharide export protein, LipB/KpsS family [Caulobacteraceae bacterium]